MKRDLTKIFIDEIYSSPPRICHPTNNAIIKSIDVTWSYIVDLKIKEVIDTF